MKKNYLLLASLALGLVAVPQKIVTTHAEMTYTVTEFAGLKLELESASDGDTVKANCNITLTELITIKTIVTLDLNGYSLFNSDPLHTAFRVEDTGHLTIIDSSESGTGNIYIYNNSYTSAIELTDEASLTLESGKIVANGDGTENNIYAIDANGTGTININGGCVSVSDTGDGCIAACICGNSAYTGTININGGELIALGTTNGLDMCIWQWYSTTNINGGTLFVYSENTYSCAVRNLYVAPDEVEPVINVIKIPNYTIDEEIDFKGYTFGVFCGTLNADSSLSGDGALGAMTISYDACYNGKVDLIDFETATITGGIYDDSDIKNHVPAGCACFDLENDKYRLYSLDSLYTVTFDTQAYGIAPEAQYVIKYSENYLITAPEAPTEAGYTFLGWYKEASCENAWDFATDLVEDNITLYAKWEQSSVPDTSDDKSNEPSTSPSDDKSDEPSTSQSNKKEDTSISDNPTKDEPKDTKKKSNGWVAIPISLVSLIGVYLAMFFTLYKKGKLQNKFFEIIFGWFNKLITKK